MLRSLAIALTVSTALGGTLAMPAAADELTAVYAQILANPTNAELNLRYASLAEARGEYRKALAAYERILVNDPTNQAAREGMQRVRRIIQPPLTQKTVEVGATWESNPLRLTDTVDGDVLGYGSFRIKDERPAGKYRWRTNLSLYGEAHARENSLNYASLAGDIGPIVDLIGTNIAVRPAIGAGTAYFDGKIYYGDVNASVLFEGTFNGAYQWLRFRAGYRDYDPSFTTDAGSYADITGRFAVQDVFHERDSLSLSPWFRWSGINGDPDNGATDFATGLYVEGGATLEYSKRFTENVSASVNFKASDRTYEDIGSGSRHDWLMSTGASLIFNNLLGPQTDIRLSYKYEWNNSNMVDHDWQNQAATIALVFRR